MSSGDSEGPAWNKFWLSLDHETESMVSGDGSHRPQTPGRSAMMTPEPSHRPSHLERGDSVAPNESASHHGDDDQSEIAAHSHVVEDAPFPFKFKAPSGRVHRIQVLASSGMTGLISNVTAKLGGELEAVGGAATFEDDILGASGYALSYLDNEGDTVSITTDQDLIEAITLARRNHRDKVDLFVHHPDQPPISATVEPRPGLSKLPTPPESEIKERRRRINDDEDEDVELSKRDKRATASQPKAEELIAGVPNDLILPGAIVTLAVVIIGVFAMSRGSSNR